MDTKTNLNNIFYFIAIFRSVITDKHLKMKNNLCPIHH